MARDALQLIYELALELLCPPLERHVELVDGSEAVEEAVVKHGKVGERLWRFGKGRRLALRDNRVSDQAWESDASTHLVGAGDFVDSLVDGEEERVALVELVAVLILGLGE